MSTPIDAPTSTPAGTPADARAELRDLRGDIRHWRKGRADTKLAEAIGDAYVALFAALLLGSAVVNVVVNIRRASDEACTATGCLEARTVLPWVVTAGAVVLVLALSRLFGPVFVTPAVDSWLMSAPVARSPLLRPRLLGAAAVAMVVAGVLAAGAATLGGFALPALLAFVASAALVALVVVCLATLSQAGAGVGARVLAWLLTTGVFATLAVLALGDAPIADPPALGLGWQLALGLGVVVAVGLVVLTGSRLDRLHRRDVSPGGALAPGISGALAGLDLALAYDVVLAHRWHRHASVRPRRGGPAGAGALVWADLVRLRRSPQTPILLAAAVVVPYAAQTAGSGRVVFLVGALVGFLAGLPLLAGLRAVSRTASIARAMPFPVQTTRLATLAVPAALLGVFGVLTSGALDSALEVTPESGAMLGLVLGLCSLAAAVRWVTGRPPDYSKPLVSTPAGAVPTNLYASIVRGFDVLLLTTAPVLLAPDGRGATFSVLISLVVLAFLTGRE